MLIRLLEITDTSLGAPYNILLVTRKQRALKTGRELGEEMGSEGVRQRVKEMERLDDRKLKRTECGEKVWERRMTTDKRAERE